MTTTVKETEHLYGYEERIKLSSSREVEKFLRPLFSEIDDVESFHVVVVNRNHQVIAHRMIGLGGISGCVADPKLIFRFALMQKSVGGIVISHNHPSGNLTPSQSDIDLTRKVKEAGKFLELQLLDHIILSPVEGKYYSFADNGML